MSREGARLWEQDRVGQEHIILRGASVMSAGSGDKWWEVGLEIIYFSFEIMLRKLEISKYIVVYNANTNLTREDNSDLCYFWHTS